MISVSLISLDSRRDLERLLPTLFDALRGMEAEVLIVENRPGSATDAWLRGVRGVYVTRNFERTGYGGNHNINLKIAQGEYFVIMNSDMVVDQRAFVSLRSFMDRAPDVVMSCPKVLNEDGSIQGLNKRYPTVLDLFLRWCPVLKRSQYAARRQRCYEMRDVGYEEVCDVEFVSGAFMFCRTSVLRRLGGFDDSYFLYFEDADLSRRMQRVGRTLYCPDSIVYHFWQRSAHKSFKFVMFFLRSAWRYFCTWGFKLW